MKNNKKSLIGGIIIGLVLAFFYFQFFAPRYETKKTGLILVKTDKWTGQSWRFVDNNWKKMSNMDENWVKIDQTLQEALNVKVTNVDSNSALASLKGKYPILKDLPEDELLERIKLVYSKVVLCNLYLADFMKVEEGRSSEVGSSK